MMPLVRSSAVLALALLLPAGCGMYGPLYLEEPEPPPAPAEAEPETQPEPEPEPDPDEDEDEDEDDTAGSR